MKNFIGTMKYIGKNLILVLGFALLPAFFFGAFLEPFSIIRFFVDYKNLVVNDFMDILVPLFKVDWMQLINWILGFILVFIIFSALIGNIENHFRSGKINLSNTWNFINNSFLGVFTYLLIFMAGYVVTKFLMALFVFITQIVCCGLGVAPTILAYVISLIVSSALLIFGLFFSAFPLLSLIHTNICGYSVSITLSEVSEVINKHFLQTLLLMFIPFVIIIPLVVLGHLFAFEMVANIVSFAIMMVYYPVLGYQLYFDYFRLERFDNVKKYFYK